jgi:hypothetical protein
MENSVAIRILKSRVVINAPGKYVVKTNSVSAYEGKFICNFNALNAYQFAKAKALVAEDKLEDACNINLSASLLNGMFVPAKGEQVHINVGYVLTKDGEQALLITGVSAIPVSAATTADWGFEKAETVIEEPAIVEAEVGETEVVNLKARGKKQAS